MDIVEKMKRDWDRRAHQDARFWIATDAYETPAAFAHSGQHDCEQLLAGLEPYLDRSWNVLEIGCGIGRLLKPLAPRFRYICGVDVSPEMILQSKNWLAGLVNVETFENTGVDLRRFGDNGFDCVFSYVAFQHMPKEVFASYLPEINRVLKPQGLLKFQIFLGATHAPDLDDTLTLRVYDERELSLKLEQAGFAILDTTYRYKHRINGVDCNDCFVLARAERLVTQPLDLHPAELRERECPDRVSAAEIQMSMALVKSYLHHGNPAAAIKALMPIVEQRSDHIDAWLMLGNLLTLENREQEAIAVTEDLLRHNPTCYKGHTLLMNLYLSTGQTEQAVRIQQRLATLGEAD
ncbi:methyltransferase domain-containing protein [Planctomycetota bacterium]